MLPKYPRLYCRSIFRLSYFMQINNADDDDDDEAVSDLIWQSALQLLTSSSGFERPSASQCRSLAISPVYALTHTTLRTCTPEISIAKSLPLY